MVNRKKNSRISTEIFCNGGFGAASTKTSEKLNITQVKKLNTGLSISYYRSVSYHTANILQSETVVTYGGLCRSPFLHLPYRKSDVDEHDWHQDQTTRAEHKWRVIDTVETIVSATKWICPYAACREQHDLFRSESAFGILGEKNIAVVIERIKKRSESSIENSFFFQTTKTIYQ